MRLFVLAAFLATCSAAPAYQHAAVAVAPAAATVVAHTPAVAHVAETYHAGPAIARTHVEHGVVGHRTVQVGSQPVQVGHEYFVAGQTVEPQPAYTYVAGEATNSQHTVAIAPPALPVAAPAPYAIPPPPTNQGPAPIDTVTQERILAPARAHTRITPQVTRIEPELQVNRYTVEVPVEVPVPVHRDVVVEKRVQKPYTVEVPRAVPVPAPYKVHQVHDVVHTPVVHKHTQTVHQPAVHAVAHVAAAPVAHVAHVAAAPAVHAEY